LEKGIFVLEKLTAKEWLLMYIDIVKYIDWFQQITNNVLLDIKPENIMLESPDSRRVRIIDLGGAAGYNEGVNIYSK
jgi:serine/threonine protein kinase